MTPTTFAPDGTYQLKLGKSNTAGARASAVRPSRSPCTCTPSRCPGTHSFGGPDARFGAPRAGHIHQGQDIPASCGQKEVVDETGQVSVNAYQAGGAGYYVVLHGALTGTDSVYMHLQRPSWAPAGTTVYAGQQIGRVGATGTPPAATCTSSAGPRRGGSSGGAAYDPLPELLYWDSYS